MAHSVTDFHPYKLMFGYKVQTLSDTWLGPAKYSDQHLQSKCAWECEQYELILAANRHALKHIKQSTKKTASQLGGSALDILKGNLVLSWDNPKDRNKIQDNYKSELFVIV